MCQKRFAIAIAMAMAMLIALFGYTGSAQAHSGEQSVPIRQGDLGEALKQLALQAHVQILYAPGLVEGKTTGGLTSQFTPLQSLQKLLSGSGLVAEQINPSTFVLKRLPTPALSPSRGTPVSPPSPAPPQQLETITVTGNLRAESLDRYPGSITPVTAAQMDQIGANSMQDYLGTIPGVSFAPISPGLSNITIRGIATTTDIDEGQQTTGVYIDGIPLTEPHYDYATPDIDTFDVDRVEVLKGPQGTAFGVGAMGGAINYIPNKPDASGFDDRFQLGMDGVEGNGSLGHVAKAMINIPVANNLAVRFVIDDRRDPGYIDDVGTHENDANTSDEFGGRFIATWNINDTTTLDWMTLYQRIRNADGFFSDSITGVMTHRSAFPEYFDTSTVINDLKFDHLFSWGDVAISVSSHGKSQHSTFGDETVGFGSLLGNLTGPIHYPESAKANGHTAEIRLTSDPLSKFEWLVGAIYDETIVSDDEMGYASGAAEAIDTIYGLGLGSELAPNDVFSNERQRVRGQQAGVYGQVSWNLASRWKLTFGDRYYSTDVDSTTYSVGFVNYVATGSTMPSLLVGEEHATGFAPMGSLSYQANADTMIYGLVSTGYRFGGPNPNPPGGTASTPGSFEPDKLTNYEWGLRTSNASKTLTASAAAYFIDWRNIQLRTTTPNGLAYEVNAGIAHSYGLEESAEWKPTSHFQWRGALAFNRAFLDKTYEQSAELIASAGTPLPGSSKWQASSTATYVFGGAARPFITVTYQYRSKATVDLFSLQPKMGNDGIFGLRGGFTVDGVTYTAYVENLGNRLGVANAYIVTPADIERYYVTPRTFGILADFSF
jgi:outer membrane receptor protein involved in Fe transport